MFRWHMVPLTKWQINCLGLTRNGCGLMKKDRICIIRQLVLPLLAYGDNIHWAANESLLHKIDSLYNRIACFVSKWCYYTHHCTMFEELGWPLWTVRREITWKTIVLKTFNPSNTPYLSKFLARFPKIQICMIHMMGMLMLATLHLGFYRFRVCTLDQKSCLWKPGDII